MSVYYTWAWHKHLNLLVIFSFFSFPLNSIVTFTGNKMDKVYEGVWKSILSGPYNVVFSHEDFVIDHYCFLGYEVAQIFTTVKEPSDELMELIWEVVGNHTEVDKSKFQKVVC
ncbi:uncharacterized protein LOC126198514 [Schistocerca nitens]|uniref:uncharacterized protein LOC126198514 n=1 Tax=Schistocerca nitens TaxID=7011 RepID=UPI0021183B9B|nr:uncharacterized protein LOC126198514 [Schistocerca nitens]